MFGIRVLLNRDWKPYSVLDPDDDGQSLTC